MLGPFTTVPFLVDHSAYDAYAIMVEADGTRLFYSGDRAANSSILCGSNCDPHMRVPNRMFLPAFEASWSL